jgi:hypothetical protein
MTLQTQKAAELLRSFRQAILGEALHEAAVHGGYQRCPRQRVSPLPHRMGLRDELGHGNVEPLTGQPMLEVAQ